MIVTMFPEAGSSQGDRRHPSWPPREARSACSRGPHHAVDRLALDLLHQRPIGAATAGSPALLADEGGIGLAAGADVPGGLLITAALMVGVYAIVGRPLPRWGDARTGLGAASLALLRRSWHARRRPRIHSCRFGLRLKAVVAANVVQTCPSRGCSDFFLGALYLRRVLHYDALGSGSPSCVTVARNAPIRYSERIVTRFGPVPRCSRGAAVMARLRCSREPGSTAATSAKCCPRWRCSASAQAWRFRR